MEEESDHEDNVEELTNKETNQGETLQPEGQAQTGGDIVPNSVQPQLTPQQLKLNQELQMKISQTITKFYQRSKQFKEDQQNVFVINNPNIYQISEIIKIWKSRQIKTQKNLLKLELNGCEKSRAALIKYFSFYPSVLMWIDGQRIENNGILAREGDCFYEGIQQYMHITNDSEQTEYEGDVINKIPNGSGSLTCRSKKGAFIYDGNFVDGKYHGKGQLKNSKNIIYVGDFQKDYKHGQGIEVIMKRKKNPVKGQPTMIKKSQYKGKFKDGYRSGFGIEQTSYGVYEGEWNEGVRSGKGKMKYKKGDIYDGEWENNEFNGEGTYIEDENLTYKGSFVGGKYHGNGVMEYQNGDKYEGEFQNGKKHGNGIYTWEDGDYYDGQWKNDSAEGHGTSMIGTDFYDGDFKNGRKHGIGELTNQDGEMIKALFENNQIKKILEKNGEPYEQES